MSRHFNPAGIVPFSFWNDDYIPKPVKRSLELFIEQLSELESDSRISTEEGHVHFSGMHEGKPFTLILDVRGSIHRELMGDLHLTIVVKVEDRTEHPCVVRLPGFPVGDHMANVIAMFHNDVLLESVSTIKDAVAPVSEDFAHNLRRLREIIANIQGSTEYIQELAEPFDEDIGLYRREGRLELDDYWLVGGGPRRWWTPEEFQTFLEQRWEDLLARYSRLYGRNDFNTTQRRHIFYNLANRSARIDAHNTFFVKHGQDWSTRNR
tara:strand:- start:49 stop:843 length:795 start_codon:yes stop_codon:yes gene_type:complete